MTYVERWEPEPGDPLPATAEPERRMCAATRVDGTPCGAFAVHDSAYCWAHDEGLAEKRIEARRQGGRRRAYVQTARPDGLPATLTDVAHGLALAIESVWAGDNTVGRALALSSLYGRLADVLESQAIERLEAELGTGPRWSDE